MDRVDTNPLSRSRSSPKGRSRRALARIGTLIAVLGIASIAGYRLGWFNYAHTVRHIEQVRQSQNLAVFIGGFILVYAVGTALGLPGLPFNAAAGALFGTIVGGVIAWTSSMIGAVIGYLIARTIGHDEVLRWVQRFKRADAAVGQARNFSGLLRMRLLPVLPIGVVNFVAGLARAPIVSYLAATAIGIVPSVIIYSYFADSLVEGVGAGRRQALISLLIASALLIVLSLGPRLIKQKRP